MDVALDAARSLWTFDIVLHVPETRLVVAECRRRTAPVKQEDFVAFAFKVDRLGQSVGLPVAGVFFAKSRYQVGALRSGRHEGVTMAVVSDREIVGEGFVIEYHRWDYMGDKRAKDATIHIGRPVCSIVASVAS